MKYTGLIRISIAILTALIFGTAVNAQYRSTISGTITDPSGSVVPKAAVTITNTNTNTSNTTTSNEVGIYAFPTLMAGKYSLKVEAKVSRAE